MKEKGYHPLVYRFLCLQSHYRKTLVFSYDKLDQMAHTFEKLRFKDKSIQNGEQGNIDMQMVELYQKRFQDTLKDDLNTASCLTVLYDLLKDDMSNATKIKLIKDLDAVLSLDLLKESEEPLSVDISLESYILSKIEERKIAKENKNFSLADSIRMELLENGIILKDTREGTLFEIKK